MNTKECAKCSKERLATSLNEKGVCRVCAPEYDPAPRSQSASSGAHQVAESSSKAIEVVGTLNNLNAAAGAILALVVIAMGLTEEAPTLIAIGFVIALVTLVVWALNRMFIGIAQDIKAIRAKLESS